MFERTGHSVLKLIRTKIAFLDIKGLNTGEYRFLIKAEVDRLTRLTEEGR